jgi:hypothetical protein
MRIEDALMQVRAIRMQVSRTQQVYYCFRWATVAASGWLALAAAAAQSGWVADPARQPLLYLQLWVSVAAVSVLLIGAEILTRWRQTESAFARRQTVLAVQQFAPCVGVGALLTGAIQIFASEYAPLFPALWSTLFCLGILASRHYLPPGSIAVAAYYLVAGLVCVRWGQGEQALRPWTMAISFGVGQLLTALILYQQPERADEQE